MSGDLVFGKKIYFPAIMRRNFYKPLCLKENYDSVKNISMGKCKDDVTPLPTHWNYVFITITHLYDALEVVIGRSTTTTTSMSFSCSRTKQIYSKVPF